MRITLCNPAKCEERRLRLPCFQHGQDPLDIAFDPALSRRPLTARDEWCKGRDLKVVLDIDRECIDRRCQAQECISLGRFAHGIDQLLEHFQRIEIGLFEPQQAALESLQPVALLRINQGA